MSVVVYHDGKMAADTRAYSGSTHPIGHKIKIFRLEKGPHAGSLLGICSNAPGQPEELRNWIEAGAERADELVPQGPSFEALLVKPDGTIFLYNDAYYAAGPIVSKIASIGSGKKYAMGAIYAGADVKRAVEIAIECDPWSGGPVTELSLIEPAETSARSPDLTLEGFSTSTQLSNAKEAP